MRQKPSLQIQAVLYHNDHQELLRALQSMESAAAQAQEDFSRITLVWGDASREPLYTQAQLDALCPAHISGMTYRYFHENTGYGRGNNLLAMAAETDYLLVMNPEILLSPRSLCDLLSPFADESVGLVEARQIPVEHPKAYDPETMETAWASGACFMTPTALFQQLGGFDTDTFFMYCEDVDLSWRVRLAGKRLYYQALAGVYHARRLSATGANQASRTEELYTVLAEVMLAYKWSYPEYARERLRMALRHQLPGSQEAREIFEAREREGTLPDFLDPEHKVARIIQYPQSGGMLFARHRF